ncbi:3-octaprenyl-4-hydroxybenzoate carboxy-lyase [Legionella geestiana]|uniref:Flavin prenyltransferase UbiX n=1 Tax=Legionella geestiana TaxID=45065 RepID=A0A0W0TP01_9GAMM|nr:UbiX family flavin prenyltransferase [Legionella geestiana]KTC97292.1 3-octaprenyl-4-hydroxybenzoate carboxy-lyase [Legionella geestiana]QBS12420.1 UbiX family flavin prenyltransferase [Legionella geestiana]QDQ39866.1 UbiX family flavin prenyltransferase [Legionella geestiana]STX55139.1 3-octaprenyl-4-hydroxybenzoate carboxy-lyase [Legionella geestiana]
MPATPDRLIIGISGATGICYGQRLLEALKPLPIETHLVVTKTAQLTRAYETELTAAALRELCDVWHPVNDFAASIASGSFRTLGMIVAPCSMRSLADIAHGTSSNLLSRAADVVLKERRRLVLLVRETPLHQVHLENMLTITRMGGIICPPVPAFYNRPQTLDDIINDTVGRALDLFDIDCGLVKRWGEADTSC